jgi:hypothetical protein
LPRRSTKPLNMKSLNLSVHPVHRRAAMQALDLDKIDSLLKIEIPQKTIISSI